MPDYSPEWGELHMGVKKSRHLGGGRLPALNSGSDKSLSLLVPNDLHQAGVALVDIVLQWSFQLLCSPSNEDYARNKTTQQAMVRETVLKSYNILKPC